VTAWAIIDTAPLVAVLDAREAHHKWATEEFAAVDGFRTCEPVITEACFLLQHTAGGVDKLWKILQRGAVRVDFQLQDHMQAVAVAMNRYANLPMSLADACLVRMAEVNPRAEIVTADRHFRVYRTSDRRVLRLRTPGF
jgi:predicted nucleic acid-binding protein